MTVHSWPTVKFDEEFVERRLREHREWQERVAREQTEEAFGEVVNALSVEAGYGPAHYRRVV